VELKPISVGVHAESDVT